MSSYNSQAMSTWAVEERPREKVMARGVQYLSEVELLAILLGSGTRQKTAVELARQIMSAHGGWLTEGQNRGDYTASLPSAGSTTETEER